MTSFRETLTWCQDQIVNLKDHQDICLDHFDHPDAKDLLKRLTDILLEVEDLEKECESTLFNIERSF
jgi:hypothetical protein